MFRRAVTIVELLVVLAIVLVLLALLIPAIHYARQSARRTTCAGHLYQLGVALSEFHKVHPNGPSREFTDDSVRGWAIDLLPFIEEKALADRLSGNPVLRSADELPAVRNLPPVLRCPARFDDQSTIAGIPSSSYTFNGSALGDLPLNSRIPWVFSPTLRLGGPAEQLPHSGGYNAVDVHTDRLPRVWYEDGS